MVTATSSGVVQRGTISAYYHSKIVYTLEEGDILLPISPAARPRKAPSITAAWRAPGCTATPALEFMRRVFNEPAAMRLWSRLLVTYSGLMLRITAAHAPEEAPATPGFEDYAPGRLSSAR